MKKYVKFLLSEFKNDSRNMREMDAVSSIYDEIIVICPQKNKDYVNTTHYKVNTYNHYLSKNKFFRFFQIVYSVFFKIPRIILKENPHTMSCQDLFALFIAWWSNLFKIKKIKLVYDSHELEIARNTNGKRGKLAKLLIIKLEKFLMRRASFSIFACDSAALEVYNIHKLKTMPLVVRNIPYKWSIDKNKCETNRSMILKRYSVPVDSFVCLYHGIIGYGRGIENLINAISLTENTVLVIMGMGDEKYIRQIKDMISNISPDKIFIIPAVDVSLLHEYVCIADVGMVTIQAVTLSYYYMLPNKFFENIQSENPIICSNFPEVSNIIEKYDIGITVDPTNVIDIANAIKKLQNDKKLYDKYKNNLINAKEILCWENERIILINEYSKLIKETYYNKSST